jgi:hypothetical protein
MQQDTRPCIACFEQIKREARKCPHCHQVQTGAAALLNSPWLGWLALAAILAMVAGMAYIAFSSFQPRTAIPKLEVGPSTLNVAADATRPRVSCFAQLKNVEATAVSDPSLQAQFYDAGGAQIDVHYDQHRLTLFPSVAAEGRVSGTPNGVIAEYKSCKLVVLNAK